MPLAVGCSAAFPECNPTFNPTEEKPTRVRVHERPGLGKHGKAGQKMHQANSDIAKLSCDLYQKFSSLINIVNAPGKKKQGQQQQLKLWTYWLYKRHDLGHFRTANVQLMFSQPSLGGFG